MIHHLQTYFRLLFAIVLTRDSKNILICAQIARFHRDKKTIPAFGSVHFPLSRYTLYWGSRSSISTHRTLKHSEKETRYLHVWQYLYLSRSTTFWFIVHFFDQKYKNLLQKVLQIVFFFRKLHFLSSELHLNRIHWKYK